MDNRVLNPKTGELLNPIIYIKISHPIDDGRIRVAAIAANTGDAWDYGFFASREIADVVAFVLSERYQVSIVEPTPKREEE